MLKIAACDDEQLYINKVKSIIKSYCNCILDEYTDSKTLECDVLSGKSHDIYILDIEMPNIDGMKLAEVIRQHNLQAIIIMMTSYDQYVFDSFKLGVFRFIPKNEMDERIPEAITAASRLVDKEEFYFTITDNSKTERLFYKDVLYISKEKNNVVFHLKNENIVQRRLSLGEISKSLRGDKFIYIERGYIINLMYVERMENNNIIMSNNDVLPVSRRKKTQIHMAVLNYWDERI